MCTLGWINFETTVSLYYRLSWLEPPYVDVVLLLALR